ncbi:hypothetical protein P5673_022840 [Acropora cervicornis]|uniref:Uncharacterized protein n=1 Tax=Acropora cervicornis TaxID=6130 RepID=A0AAD9Q6Y1_ACRCE|nr:hypothetical protein P5673_022840 [Acropora cervicornis]
MRSSIPTLRSLEETFTLEIMARDWIVLFTSLGGTVPRNKHDGIKKFTGQGIEKLNDDCRKIHLYRDPLVGKQMEHVSEYEGASRKYKKQDQNT